MPTAKKTNRERFEAAGMVDPKHKFSPEEHAAIESLSAEEVKTLIAIKKRFPGQSADAQKSPRLGIIL
jgi:hypothetical protein